MFKILPMVVVGTVGAAMCLAMAGCNSEPDRWEPIDTGLRAPLAEVTRKTSLSGPFDAPALVVVARIRERCEVEVIDEHRRSLNPPIVWPGARAEAISIVRVNERRPSDPDLTRRGGFVIEQRDIDKKLVRFAFGRIYLLLLNPSPYMSAVPSQRPSDAYVFGPDGGGFEVVRGRLRPLVSGSALEAYAGRDANELIKELQVK
jgi:hypothetical protein